MEIDGTPAKGLSCGRATANFETRLHDNTEAHSRCLTETGAFLATAQDDEAAAVNELINASAGDLRGIARKVDALQDMLEIGGIWSDRRDIRMLASVQRDIRTMMRRVA